MTYSACTSILIGRQASTDGSIMIGRNEDAKAAWPKHMVVHPYQELTTPQSFVSQDNGFTMPLPTIRFKYTATPEWTAQYGLFEEDGFNQFGVAMSATESTYSNDQVLGADPLVPDGIGEEAMVTVVLPYVKTAREGVQRLGAIIEHYGTCESNGILFSDQQEAWYLETGAGHYWVAQRIPDDAYAVVANQMAIQTVDFHDPDHFLFAPNLEKFVAENHLSPHPDRFVWRDIFGTKRQSDTVYNTPRVWYGQRRFNPEIQQDPTSQTLPFIRRASRLLSLTDAQAFLSSHYEGTVYDPLGAGSQQEKTRFRPVSLAKTQESHVLQTRPHMAPEVAGIQWLAMGVAAQSVYVPFYAGIQDTPASYQLGTATYDRDSAYWTYKLVSVLVDGHLHAGLPLLEEQQSQLRVAFAQQVQEADRVAQHLSGTELTDYLTQVSMKAAELGLTAYRELAAKLITQSTDLGALNYHQDLNL